jgi:glycosyltransferase involved in cell wall biosynthesis
MYSLIVPVYRNVASLPRLIEVISDFPSRVAGPFEAVFVVDGSPDESYALLKRTLASAPFAATLLALSRNFGSFAAIRAGLGAARGRFFAVMAADLQEPPDLALAIFQRLAAGEVDVVLGVRDGRSDPFLSRLAAAAFWRVYRRFVQYEMPPGGIDVFGCNEVVRETLLRLRERNTSLVGLLLWVGFRRSEVSYRRLERYGGGRSGWSFARKLRYMQDSIFAFSDLPIRLLVWLGAAGMAVAVVLGLTIFFARLTGTIAVPGYSALSLLVLFFGAANLASIGLVGSYVWRAFENTKGRPDSIVLWQERFER